MTPAALAELISATAADVLAERGFDAAALDGLAVTVRRPRHPGHGDYATNVAMRGAGRAGVEPRELAGWLAAALGARTGIAAAEVAGPGFVNVRLAPAARAAVVREALRAGAGYGGGTPWRVDPPADLVAAVGPDAARFALAYGTGEADRGRWSRHTDDNPAHVVRYAHARLASLARNAADLGMTADGADLDLLADGCEAALVCVIGEYPDAVAAARVARYLEELAGAGHRFLDVCRVLPRGDEPVSEVYRARLALGAAARQVLANGLGLLGVTAPERL